jgi:hypothetical protein
MLWSIWLMSNNWIHLHLLLLIDIQLVLQIQLVQYYIATNVQKKPPPSNINYVVVGVKRKKWEQM